MTNFTFQNGITPVNEPLMDRKRTVNGPSVSWKLFTLLFALILGFGQMWGDTYTLGWGTASGTTGTYSNFTATSGSVTNIVSFSSDKNSSSNAPAYNSSSSELRLYYASNGSGGSVTLTPATGVTITGFVMTTSTSPSVKYSVNGGSATSVSVNNNTYTVTGISASTSLKIQNVNTTNTQLRIKTIAITYTVASSKTLSSIAVQTAPTKKKYVAGETFDPTGLIITRTYSDKTSDTYAYAGHTSDFTFSPTTSAALTTSNTSVSITYGGKSTSQSINVYNVTLQARDEDGNTIPSGGPGAPSRTGKSITPAADANNYVFKQWQVTNASLGSSESTKSNTITNPTGAVTVTAVYHKPITITYKANGQDFTTQTYGYGGTLAFPANGPNGDTYSCTGKTFTGWVAEANKDYSHATTAPTYATAGGSVTVAATYYAVFANASGNKTTKTDNITRTTTGVTANSTNYSAWSGKTLTSSATYAGQSAGGNSAIQLRNQSPSGVISTASGGTLKKITITWNSNTTASRYVTIFGKATAYSQTSDLYNNSYKGTELGTITKGTSTELNVTGTYNYVGILASAAIYIDNIALQWEVDNVTYTNFETTCCTPLGQINGAVSVGSINETGGTATWTWKNGTATGVKENILKVYNTNDVCVKTIDKISGSATFQSIGGLDPCTTYYVTLTTVPNTGYCAGEEQGKSANFSTNGWAVHYEGGDETEGALLSNVTKQSGATQACLSENYVATFTANTGYKLPDNIIVYIAGVEVDVDDAYTWAISNGTGTLTVFTSELSEEIDVRIIGECVEPEVTADPADADYYIGDEPEDLSVSATLASGTLTYLWQKSTDNGANWSNVGTNSNTLLAENISTASEGTLKFKCIVGNQQGGCTVESVVATITVSKASYFPNGKTIFIQAHSTSAWTGGGCVKAWFHTAGGSETAQSTYWLFDATGDDTGKKLFATVVPASGNLPYMDIQRFASNCNDWWNKNGGCSYADAEGSNTVRSFNKHDDSSEGNYVAWNGSGVTMNLMSSDAWLTPVAAMTDQGAGVWTGTYEYTPTNTSTEYVIATNYNGNIGNKVDNDHQNENAVLSDMIVGSTYNVTATLNVITHALTMSKEFVKGEVKFDLQDHGSAIAKLTDITAGSKISAPSEPSATGYTFGGWFKEPACTNEWDFDNDVVNETMTLYAKWTANTYTITKTFSNVANAGLPASFVYTGHTTEDLNSTFTVDGDNFFLPNSITVTMGGSTLAAGTDYTYDNSNGAFTFNKIIDGNIVITASATAKLKSIDIITQPNTLKYFVGENFSNTGAVVTATMGDGSNKTVTANWTAPATPLAAGTGLTVTASYTENGINMTANTTIDVYSVTVKTTDPDGVEFTVAGVTATWTVGTKALAAGVGSTNYVFKEWEVTGATIGSTTNATTTLSNPTADVVVNAKFYKPIAIEWKVGSGNAGTGTTEVKYGTQMNTLSLPTDVVDGDLASCGANKFMGWSNNALNGKVQSAPGDLFNSITATTQITSDKTFYAVFASVTSGGGASVGTTMWAETWSNATTSTGTGTPTKTQAKASANCSTSKGTTIYGSASVTYSETDENVYCRNENTGGGTAPELLLSSGKTWTISGIPTGSAATLTLTFKTNKTSLQTVSVATNDAGKTPTITGSITNGTGTYTITTDGASTINITFGNNSNTRLDNLNVAVASTSSTTSDYQTSCCTTLGAVSNINVVPARESATVSWNKLANASGYEYKLGDADWAEASVADANNPSITLSPLTGATSYAIQIRATGDGETYCGKGTASAVTNFKTLSRVTAAVNDGARGTAKVSLTSGSGWADYVDAADGTTIYLQATASSEDWILGSWSDPSSGSIAAGQLTGWTGDVTVTANFAAAELPTLATPTGMSSSNVTAISATISWNAVANASSYAVVCDGATIGAVTVTDGVASCPLTILSANTTYNWTVQAIGDNINYQSGPVCESQSFTTDKKIPTLVEITHAPTVTEYLEGESFAPAGMTVKVTYNTGEIDGAYTGYTITPNGALTYGTTAVTITASMNDVSVSTTQAITVHKKYTLTIKNNGTTIETRNFKEGDKYSDNNYGDLPTLTAGDACDGTSTTFMGWLKDATITTKQPDAPASYASKDDVMGTADVVLNAVWAKVSGNDGADVNTVMWAENWNNATISNGSTGQSSANPDDNCSTSKGTTIYNSASISYTQSSSDYVYCRNENSAKGESSPELYIKANNSWTISGIPTGNAATLTLKFTTNAPSSLSTLTVSTTEVGKTPTMSGSITGSSAPYTGTYTITTDGASTLQIVFGHNSNVRLDDISLKVATKNISYTDYITTCCDDWSVTASYGVGNVINANDEVAVTITGGNTYGTPEYESSDENVLTVASNGTITGVKAGSATVSIAWPGSVVGGKCAFETSVDVTVNGPITVTYNANDGSLTPETTSQNATSNSAFTLDANSFSRTGYTFQGWATTPSGSKEYYNSQANVEFAEDITLYAVWSINSHAVTLTQPTGNTIEATGAANLASVVYGTSITLSATESDGYVFTGWSTEDVVLENTNPVVFTMPDKDVAVTATYSTYEWVAADPHYSVTTAPKISYTKVEKFSTAGVVIKENFKRSDDNTITKQEDYDGAWTAKLNGTPIANNDALSLDDNGKTLKLYIGEVEIASYTLTVEDIAVDQFFDGLWGEEFDNQTGTYDMPTPEAHDAGAVATCKDHNIFIGWVLEENMYDLVEDNVIKGTATKDITANDKKYYAVWAKEGTITRTIRYGWETGESTTGWMISGSTVASPVHAGTKAGQISQAGRAIKAVSSIANPESMTVYYTKNSGNTNKSNYFKLQYSAASDDDGTWTDIVSGKDFSQISNGVYEELTADLSDNAYKGKYFRVWFNGATTSGNIDDVSISYKETGAVDYITDCDARYDIEFLAGEGADGSYETLSRKEDAVITLPDGSALSKTHYSFAGWYSASYDEVFAGSASYTVPYGGDILEAQWTEDHFGTVTFKNGETTTSTIKVYDGGLFNLAAAPSKDNNEFIGWKWNETIYAANLPNQHMDNPAEDRTYTAVWMPVIDVATADAADLSDGKWILVQNKSQLKAGDFIVIAAAGYDKALNTDQGMNRSATAVTKTMDTLTYDGNVAPLFLQYDSENDYYAMYDRANTGYLYSNNNLKTQDGLSMQALWRIEIVNKKASIVAQGNNNDKTMRYNNSNSGVFSTYSSASEQNDIAIYKWAKNISSDMNVSDVTNTDMVIVKDGATLTIDETSTLDNLIVEAGGEVVLDEAKLTVVGTFAIEASMATQNQHKSGQLTGATNANIAVNGEAYIDITLGANGTNQQWHAFTVPFPVDVMNGIYDLDGNKLINETNYAIMEYFGDLRAQGKYGWKKIRTTLVPGTFYIMATDGYRTTYRFKKIADEPLVSTNSKSLEPYPVEGEGVATEDNGWNGVGNPTLMYGKVNYNVYVLDPDIYDYVAKPANMTNFIVGTPFFIQAESNGSMSMLIADASANYAPARVQAKEIKNVDITFGNEVYTDHLYISASEDALDEYQTGKDLVRLSMTNTPRVGRIFCNAYGNELTMVYAPLRNDKAVYDLSLYAPANGKYTIAAPEMDEIGIYLTYQDRIIWSLTSSPYEIELPQGTTEGYGLKLVAAPKTPTGLENTEYGVQNTDVQKVIINDQVFILRGGQMYDVTGKIVK